MSSRVVLTVVVAARNVARFLPELSRSLTAKTSTDVEYVFVNDGSGDGTGEGFDRLAARLPRARTIHHASSRGISASRNAGILAADGRYVTFMDGDDWVRPGFHGNVAARAAARGTDVLKFPHVEVHDYRRTRFTLPCGLTERALNPRDYILPLDKHTLIDTVNAWSTVCRRDFLRESALFDEELLTAEDRHWMWRVMTKAESISVEDDAGYFWRRGVSDSLTQTGDERQLHFIDAYRKIVDYLDAEPELRVFIPKAHRALTAVYRHHILLADRLSPELQDRLFREARAFLAGLSPEMSAIVVGGSERDRRTFLLQVAAGKRPEPIG